MKLVAIQGKNYRNYIEVIPETKDDLVNLKHLETIVSRAEFLPYSKSFDKWARENYFINKQYIPSQFFQDIQKNFINVIAPEIKIENSQIFFNPDINKEKFLDFVQGVILPPKFDLTDERYAYQAESVYRALLFKTARIEVGTGGGKTLITYLYCRYLLENFVKKDMKILIIVPRKDLAIQTKKAFEEFNELNENQMWIETIYSGSRRYLDAHIVIGTWQSLKEYEKEYFDDFSVLICDEAHSAKAYSIRVDIYNKCFNVEYVFGMTGTYPEYKTLDYLNIVAMFGANVLTKTTKELIADGNVCPVLINKIQINYNDEVKDFSKNLLLSGIVGGEKYRAEKVWFQNYEPRTKLIAKLCNGFQYNHLILVESVEYVKFLQEYLQEHCPERHVDIIWSGVNNREEIKDEMAVRHDMILIATYETMSTGVSINNIMHVHFPDGGRSPIRIKQSLGRGLRLHLLKDYLNVFDYQDQMVGSSFKNHAKERNNIYEAEGHPSKISVVNI